MREFRVLSWNPRADLLADLSFGISWEALPSGIPWQALHFARDP